VWFAVVSGDSRCPADAMCIQGGDAIVTLQVTSANDTREVELFACEKKRWGFASTLAARGARKREAIPPQSRSRSRPPETRPYRYFRIEFGCAAL
jgi:hypothetical protein